jgi:hypothetical protein
MALFVYKFSSDKLKFPLQAWVLLKELGSFLLLEDVMTNRALLKKLQADLKIATKMQQTYTERSGKFHFWAGVEKGCRNMISIIIRTHPNLACTLNKHTRSKLFPDKA